MKPRTTITHSGETLSLRQWSDKTGIHVTTIANRIHRGWSPEKALTTKADLNSCGYKPISKNEAKWYLDDLPRDQLPKCLLPLLRNFKGRKFGDWLDRHHKAAFNTWFTNEYVPMKQAAA